MAETANSLAMASPNSTLHRPACGRFSYIILCVGVGSDYTRFLVFSLVKNNLYTAQPGAAINVGPCTDKRLIPVFSD